MLAKKFRLKKEKDIKKVLSEGRFLKNDYLKLKLKKNDLEHSRFATPVGLKISKKAVTRNKIKRRLQEALRLKWEKIKQGYDVLLMVEKPIADKSYQQIAQTLAELLRKAGLLRQKNDEGN
jgi:ribonuclease P protein component